MYARCSRRSDLRLPDNFVFPLHIHPCRSTAETAAEVQYRVGASDGQLGQSGTYGVSSNEQEGMAFVRSRHQACRYAEECGRNARLARLLILCFVRDCEPRLNVGGAVITVQPLPRFFERMERELEMDNNAPIGVKLIASRGPT